MSDTELELAQLLCTRLCHDLAGPVGAVAAGVELIGGDPAQADLETLGLIGNSSAAASLKLKFMRAADQSIPRRFWTAISMPSPARAASRR